MDRSQHSMKRILLKLSGEALAGDKKTGFDEPTVTAVARQVKECGDGTSGRAGRARRSTGQRQIRLVCLLRS